MQPLKVIFICALQIASALSFTREMHASCWKRVFNNRRMLLATCFILTLSACGGGTTVNSSGNPITPIINISNTAIMEGNAGTSNLTFTVTLNAASTNGVSVNYATSNGTALAASDYTATNGTLGIAAGKQSGTITVSVFGDTLVEPDETLTLTLSTPTNATLGNATATANILNDDLNTQALIGKRFYYSYLSESTFAVGMESGELTIGLPFASFAPLRSYGQGGISNLGGFPSNYSTQEGPNGQWQVFAQSGTLTPLTAYLASFTQFFAGIDYRVANATAGVRTFLGVIKPTLPPAISNVTGTYNYVLGIHFQIGSRHGSIVFDGAGGFTNTTMVTNQLGVVSTFTSSGSYSINADGSVKATFPSGEIAILMFSKNGLYAIIDDSNPSITTVSVSTQGVAIKETTSAPQVTTSLYHFLGNFTAEQQWGTITVQMDRSTSGVFNSHGGTNLLNQTSTGFFTAPTVTGAITFVDNTPGFQRQTLLGWISQDSNVVVLEQPGVGLVIAHRM